MRTTGYIAVLLLITGIISSCTGYKIPPKRVKGEKIELRVLEDPEYLNTRQLLAQNPRADLVSRGGPLLVPFIGQTFSFAFNTVKKLFRTDVTKYKSTYGCGKNQLSFYQHVSTESMTDPSGIQLKGLELCRSITSKSGTQDTAFFASFSLDRDDPYELLNNGRFRLRLDSLNFAYPRTRIKHRQFLVPSSWFYFRKAELNLDISIAVYASWMTEQTQVFSKVQLGSFQLHLEKVPLNKESKEYAEYFDRIRDTLMQGSCFLIPRSIASLKSPDEGFQRCFNQGLYDVVVSITETGVSEKKSLPPANYEMLLNPMEPFLLQQILEKLNLK